MIQRRTRTRRDAFATAPAFSDFFDELNRIMPWRNLAACKGEDTELFFGDTDSPTTAQAKAICARCPVRAECLDHALRFDERGVWGGTLYSERLKMIKRLSGTRSA